MSKKTRLLALMLVLSLIMGMLAACGGPSAENSNDPTGSGNPANSGNPTSSGDPNPTGGPEGPSYTITENDPNQKYTYQGFLTNIPANWNPLDYEDNNSSALFDGLLTDGFYQFVFNDELHPLEGSDAAPYEAYVIIPSMATGMPVDVTEQVKADHPDWIPASATSGYAWAVTLRDDLYFDTGYHITADTFVQTMKWMLDPKLQNYRASDQYSGARALVGAEAYALDYSGQMNVEDNSISGYRLDAMEKNADGQYTMDGHLVYIAVDYPQDYFRGNTLKDYVEAYGERYFGLETWDDLVALADENGMVPCTDDNLALLSGVTTTNPNWNETDADLYNYLVFLKGVYPDELVFEDTVGYFAMDEYTVVTVLAQATQGFYLYYGGLKDTLVEPNVYEQSLYQDEAGNWYSNYMTSVETSPSYGPYSMSEYQTDKMVHYVKNDSWYGYHDDVNHVYKDPVDGNVYRMYQTTEYDIQAVSEDATQKNMFLAGKLMTYSLKPEDYDQYGFSDYVYASPADTIMFMILTGDLDGLQAREAAADFDQSKYDIETITLESFRRAFAITFDKQSFVDEVHPAYTPGYGLFGTTIIYDPDSGETYRSTDEAKKALCDFYSVDTSKFASLDDAVASITGYDPITAKEYYKKAFEEALELGYITDNDNDGICDQELRLTYAISDAADVFTRRVKFFNDHIGDVIKGTPFEGKISFVESSPKGDPGWSDAVKNGECDIVISGWTGSAMDPYYLLTAYTHSGNAYAANWYYPEEDMLTLTIKGESITMSVYDWVEAVNGAIVTVNGKQYCFGTNDADGQTRLEILAGVEGAILQTYSYLPLTNAGSKFLLSQKVYYVIEEYNPVLGRGGVTYMRYNYTDDEWAEYVDQQIAEHGQLQY